MLFYHTEIFVQDACHRLADQPAEQSHNLNPFHSRIHSRMGAVHELRASARYIIKKRSRQDVVKLFIHVASMTTMIHRGANR